MNTIIDSRDDGPWHAVIDVRSGVQYLFWLEDRTRWMYCSEKHWYAYPVYMEGGVDPFLLEPEP